MTTFNATYFDGNSARPHAVIVSLREETGVRSWHLEGEDVRRIFPAADVRVARAVGRATRFLHLPDGGCCETNDHENIAALDAADTKPGLAAWVSRLEHHTRLVAVATVLLAVGAVAVFQWALPHLARRAVSALPESIERELAKGTLATLDYHIFNRTTLSWDRQQALRDRFTEFVAQTGHARPVHLKFRAMRDDTANAFALPDGTVIVTDRLVLLAQNEDEVIAVLAHELGHLHYHHTLRQLLQNSVTLLLVTSLTGDVSVMGNFAATLPLAVLTAKYSREAELEADAFALESLRRAEIYPQAFLLIMGRIEEHTRRAYKNEEPPFLSTHPPTSDRLKAYEQASKAHEDRAPAR